LIEMSIQNGRSIKANGFQWKRKLAIHVQHGLFNIKKNI